MSPQNDDVEQAEPGTTYPAGKKVRVGRKIMWSDGGTLTIKEDGSVYAAGDLYVT